MSFRLLKILTEIQENVQGSGNNLATSNQSQQILTGLNTIESLVNNLPVVNYSTELATLLTVLNSLTSSVNALPTQTYTTELSSLQTAVDAIPVIDYSNRFNSVDNAIQAIRDNQQNQGGTSGNVPNYSSQLNNIETRVNLLPSYSSQNDTANISTKVDDLAILVGGKASSSQANNIYSDTQAIKNTELPKLATGNQVNSIQSSISNLNSSVASISTYNASPQIAQLIARQTNQATSTQATGIANQISNLPTYNASFNGVNTKLDSIQASVSSISGNGGSAASVVSFNTTQLIAPYTASNPERDLVYLFGAFSTGYSSIGTSLVQVTANSTEQGSPANIFNKTNGSWYSTNSSGRFLTIDFGFSNSSRNIVLTGLGVMSFDISGNRFPATLVISGSNNNSSYTTINTWTSIGFTTDVQWKYNVFSNSTAYRYIRITQSTVNAGGDNYFAMRELRLYGTINNP